MKAAWPRHRAIDTVGIRESIDSIRAQRVDAENAILYGVKILGLNSDNGRVYTRECVADAIERKLYENAPFRINHQRKKSLEAGDDRPSQDTAGIFRNIVQGDDGCPYGDLYLLKTHEMTPRIIEAAQRELANPADKFFALSHDAFWLEREIENGVQVIKRLREVASIDLVADGATNDGLFESRRRPVPKLKLRKLLESAGLRFKEGTRGRSIPTRIMEDMEPSLLDGETATEADEPEKMKPEEHLKRGMMEACHSLVEAYGSGEMDADDMHERMKEITKAHDGLTTKNAEEAESEGVEDAEEGEPKKTPANESRKSNMGDADRRLLTELKEKDACRELCESKNFRPSAVQLRALVPLGKADREALIEEFKTATKSSGIRTQGDRNGNVRESRGGALPELPKDAKSFADSIRERARTFRRN